MVRPIPGARPRLSFSSLQAPQLVVKVSSIGYQALDQGPLRWVVASALASYLASAGRAVQFFYVTDAIVAPSLTRDISIDACLFP